MDGSADKKAIDPKTFSVSLREARESRGWNQTELGTRAGFRGGSFISRLEGGRPPSARTISRLAAVLPELRKYEQEVTPDQSAKLRIQAPHEDFSVETQATGDIFVISRDLELDYGGVFNDVMRHNFGRLTDGKPDVTYRFLTMNLERATALESRFKPHRDHFAIRVADRLGVCFFDEIVVYSPAEEKHCRGVVRGIWGDAVILNEKPVIRLVMDFVDIWNFTQQERGGPLPPLEVPEWVRIRARLELPGECRGF